MNQFLDSSSHLNINQLQQTRIALNELIANLHFTWTFGAAAAKLPVLVAAACSVGVAWLPPATPPMGSASDLFLSGPAMHQRNDLTGLADLGVLVILEIAAAGQPMEQICRSVGFFFILSGLNLTITNWRFFWSLHMKPPRILHEHSKKIEKFYKFSQKLETSSHQSNNSNYNSH